MSQRHHVVLLYGGKSTEHEVSCRSAAFILKNLDPELYDVSVVGIDKQGQWIVQDARMLRESTSETLPINPSTDSDPSSSLALLQRLTQNALQLPGCSTSAASDQNITVVFPMLHGTYGEDGNMQGLLELAGVAYVGPDTLGSALSMDKDVAKRLVAHEGIPIVPYRCFSRACWDHETTALMNEAEQSLGWPMFVKPAKLGSSVGVRRVYHRQDLEEACKFAFELDDKLLLEKALDVREIECAVIGDGYSIATSMPGEVATHGQVYSYETKYIDNADIGILIPAPIEAEQTTLVRSYAERIFRVLELYGLSRIDFFLTDNPTCLYFNEVNTMPGFTSISQFPLLWKHSGLEGTALVNRLIALAVERYHRRSKLKRSRA